MKMAHGKDGYNAAKCTEAARQRRLSVEAKRAVPSLPAPAAVREAIAGTPRSWPERTPLAHLAAPTTTADDTEETP